MTTTRSIMAKEAVEHKGKASKGSQPIPYSKWLRKREGGYVVPHGEIVLPNVQVY